MNRIKYNRIIQILYPLFVYYIFYNSFYSIFAAKFSESKGQLFCLMLAGIVTLFPVSYIFYKSPKLIPSKITDFRTIIKYFLAVICVVVLAIAINIIISQSNIFDYSSGFSRAEKTLLDGEIAVKIACNVIVIPILEEVLYRGIIAGQVCLWHGYIVASVISAICFGISHFNIVQFLYAFIVGLALGVMYCKTKRLSLCILAHSLINLIVILFT